VLEIGAGYTTCVLLRALADNLDDFHRERREMEQKTARYHASASGLPIASPAFAESAQDIYAAVRDWELSPPALADPAYYRRPYQPALHVFDRPELNDQRREAKHTEPPQGASEPDSTHGAVAAAMSDAMNDRLSRIESILQSPPGILHVHRRDFAGGSTEIPAAHRPIELAWMDCGGYPEYRAFLDEYWEVISPDGGLIVLHYTVNNPLLAHIVKDLKLRQATTDFGKFELLSLLEPHKYRQNSCTILRRISGCVEDFEQSTRPLNQLNAEE
jgi:hypothetical protein